MNEKILKVGVAVAFYGLTVTVINLKHKNMLMKKGLEVHGEVLEWFADEATMQDKEIKLLKQEIKDLKGDKKVLWVIGAVIGVKVVTNVVLSAVVRRELKNKEEASSSNTIEISKEVKSLKKDEQGE